MSIAEYSTARVGTANAPGIPFFAQPRACRMASTNPPASLFLDLPLEIKQLIPSEVFRGSKLHFGIAVTRAVRSVFYECKFLAITDHRNILMTNKKSLERGYQAVLPGK
jgi:hypothetical protein